MAAKKASKVKPVSRDTGFSKLRSLACFDEVNRRLCEGYPLKEVAQYIQDEEKEYLEVKRESLIWTLDAYRNTIPKAQLLAKRMPPVFAKAAETVRKGLDELEELENLYKLQMQRIEIDRKNEKNIGKLLHTMTPEIKAAKDILSTIAQLKMDLGLSKRHLGQLDVDARVMADVQTRYAGKPSVTQVLNNAESRRKLLGLVDQVLALESKVEDAEIVDDEDENDPIDDLLGSEEDEDKP